MSWPVLHCARTFMDWPCQWSDGAELEKQCANESKSDAAMFTVMQWIPVAHLLMTGHWYRSNSASSHPLSLSLSRLFQFVHSTCHSTCSLNLFYLYTGHDHSLQRPLNKPSKWERCFLVRFRIITVYHSVSVLCNDINSKGIAMTLYNSIKI